MGWFNRKSPQFISISGSEQKPAQETIEGRDRIPKDLFHRCKGCGFILLTRDFRAKLSVCPQCNHHDRIRAHDRIHQLVDEGSFEEFDGNLVSADPLEFEDKRKYVDYIAASRSKTGINDAVVSGMARMGEVPVSLAVMDFAFMGGSMGSVVGEKVTRAMERALERRCACITTVSTGGARMQEGILSLMQMAKTSMLCAKLNRAGLPYLVVLTDPSTAGVMASFASLGDMILAEPKAYVGFAGRRVIENTIKQQLPPPSVFQNSEFQQQHGFVDLVVSRSEMRVTIIRILRQLQGMPPWDGNGDSTGLQEPTPLPVAAPAKR